MAAHSLALEAIRELEPGPKWARLFARHWPAYQRWYLCEGDAARPGYLSCVRALRYQFRANTNSVIASSDCMWGVLDGINDAGLVVSLAFGGRRVVGEGFGVPLVLRYVLELCDSVAEARAVLARVPVHMAYNVTLLDAAGHFTTALLAPDRAPVFASRAVATNHQQDRIEWPQYVHATGSLDREALLRRHVDDAAEDPATFVERFLRPPLHSTQYAKGFGTLYTAVYRPSQRAVELHWPGAKHWSQSFAHFEEGALPLVFPGA